MISPLSRSRKLFHLIFFFCRFPVVSGTCCCSLLYPALKVPQQTHTVLVNMLLLADLLTPFNMHGSARPTPPSAALIQMCQIQLRGKRPGSLLIGAIMEFHGNKLPSLTVTVQWLGPTLVMWPWRASSLWESIMGKWSFAIELCNDKYWLISVGLTVLLVHSPIIAVLPWVHHDPLLLFNVTSRTPDAKSEFSHFIEIYTTRGNHRFCQIQRAI